MQRAGGQRQGSGRGWIKSVTVMEVQDEALTGRLEVVEGAGV